MSIPPYIFIKLKYSTFKMCNKENGVQVINGSQWLVQFISFEFELSLFHNKFKYIFSLIQIKQTDDTLRSIGAVYSIRILLSASLTYWLSTKLRNGDLLMSSENYSL